MNSAYALDIKCNAIISVGRNKGKSCNRIKCSIIGHDKFKEGKLKCPSIIKIGRNKGL
jgi:hypothetical protein